IVKPSSEKVEPQIAPSDPPPHTADLQPNKTERLVSPHKDMPGHIEAVLQQPSPGTGMAQFKPLIQKTPPDSEDGEKAVLRPEPIQKAALSPHQVGASKYPFSIYLGSFMSLDRTRKAVSIFKKDHEISPYWVKVNLGNKGTWYRVFTGYFHSAAEADAFFKKKNLKECEVRRTNYAILLGEFAGQEEAEEMIHRLSQIGYSSYFMPGPEGGFKLYSGVYKTPEDARDQQAELASKGIESTVVER
ncbi:MAG: SPOR domain-containing protein, partial [Deltaproteobacteria bacterium]|nr:SPOR domain-containing protein [Deltaproteobacteria bacterium]